MAAGDAPQVSIDWEQVAENFRIQKLEHGTSIKLATWDDHYAPVIGMAVDLLTGDEAPTNPADLIDRCIRDWPPGSRIRQIRA